tara:strand:+ start:641 stop:883 length:243 start_codon:yes stop_codon:yes gene_type:complete
MPIESFIHHTARCMLGVKEINLDLRNYLDDIEMYANLVDGSIASRQVVAIALASYRRIRLAEKGVDYLSKKRREEKRSGE